MRAALSSRTIHLLRPLDMQALMALSLQHLSSNCLRGRVPEMELLLELLQPIDMEFAIAVVSLDLLARRVLSSWHRGRTSCKREDEHEAQHLNPRISKTRPSELFPNEVDLWALADLSCMHAL